MLGILMVWSASGTVIFRRTAGRTLVAPLGLVRLYLTVSRPAYLLRSGRQIAQFPLHVWLPDAMEGPTPVSALIHAATMVAAGVFMLARVFFLFEPAPIALDGGRFGSVVITSLLAALMATQQDDIKRILAYSTLSQLG